MSEFENISNVSPNTGASKVQNTAASKPGTKNSYDDAAIANIGQSNRVQNAGATESLRNINDVISTAQTLKDAVHSTDKFLTAQANVDPNKTLQLLEELKTVN